VSRDIRVIPDGTAAAATTTTTTSNVLLSRFFSRPLAVQICFGSRNTTVILPWISIKTGWNWSCVSSHLPPFSLGSRETEGVPVNDRTYSFCAVRHTESMHAQHLCPCVGCYRGLKWRLRLLRRPNPGISLTTPQQRQSGVCADGRRD
jgi:hypothetical protein